ncbi:Hypothetical_protein [Hexamita inflata]|uniref:Hypothetical_protein n=1 Tax=Hexamita inflata TaxID=28002 RepID=A0AA86UYZ8_9EUKA|nr:Hypothetical protein HINF_LOCUS65340 [Hexamita inflata]
MLKPRSGTYQINSESTVKELTLEFLTVFTQELKKQFLACTDDRPKDSAMYAQTYLRSFFSKEEKLLYNSQSLQHKILLCLKQLVSAEEKSCLSIVYGLPIFGVVYLCKLTEKQQITRCFVGHSVNFNL